MELKDIKKILIVGGGTMGRQIGFQCAAHGYSVTIYDIEPDTLAEIVRRLNAYAEYLVNGGHLNGKTAEDALSRISTTTDAADAARDADILSESVPEDPALKGRIFARFNELCPARTIFATNTSLLVPSLMAQSSGRPDRLLSFHFHQPAWIANVVDIMPHPGTSSHVVTLMREFAEAIDQSPMVLNKENHGYVFNAMFSALTGAAVTLAANGVASPEDIDRAWKGVLKTTIGPLGMLDVVGLDTAWHIAEYWAQTLNDPQTVKNAKFLKEEYVDKGWVGVKKGRGFFEYSDAAH